MITLASLNLQHISNSKLGNLLIDAKKAYYTSSQPIMDDHTYDTLEDILKKRNPHHRLFNKVGNPNFDTGWPKQKHNFPLGSQNKVNSFSELKHYFNLKKIPPNTNFVVQPKCDGLSLALNYQKGQLVSAVTRGNGLVGDLITQNVIYMKNLTQDIPIKKDITIRCEILVTLKDFAKLNRQSDVPYTNPRNAASGISQRLDSQNANYCSLFAVDIFSDQITFDTEQQKIAFIKKLGFTAVDSHFCQNYSQIEKIYKRFLDQKRQNYAYEIDGLVIKINQLHIQNRLGYHNGRPKGQVAYKFPSNTNKTVIKKINWQIGPLGSVTPVAQVAPVNLSGATITKASLANYQLLKQKNINIGDVVKVSRRGDVIPYIEKIITKVSSGHAHIPRKCPNCHTKLIKQDRKLICPNFSRCPPQVIGRLNLFCRKLNILGISKKTIEKLHQHNLVITPADFYKLTISDIDSIEGLGHKSAQNIIFQINQKKQLTLAQLFESVSIAELSIARLNQIIQAGFNTPRKLLNLRVGDLQKLDGFQQTLSQKITSAISYRKQAILELLKQIELKDNQTNQKLSNLTFAISGGLSQPRSYFEKIIMENNGHLSSSISQKTSYLITNQPDSTSNKISKAKKLNIPIINENQFYRLLS